MAHNPNEERDEIIEIDIIEVDTADDSTAEWDDISSFENHATSKKLPVGWLVISAILLAWCVYYTIAYTPAISGWTQDAQFQQELQTNP